MTSQAHGFNTAVQSHSLSVDEARERIFSMLPAIQGDECLAIRAALNRHLAVAVSSDLDVPSHSNSAMDGYALRAGDTSKHSETQLKVVGKALAGHPFDDEVAAGECVLITTGAIMPRGADSVVIKEAVTPRGQDIVVSEPVKTGANVRAVGEDVARGSEVFAAGHKLRPADIGVLASLGISELKVKRPLRVAFFSTGDELRPVGTALKPGEIYDSNRYTLYSMLSAMGCEILDMGIIADEPEAIRKAFREASEIADLILTSGGVSVGDADYVKMVLKELGRIDFWKINMKPGRPLAFGSIGKAMFFGLPGNPVAVMVTFYQFVYPALRRMLGEDAIQAPMYQAICRSELRKTPGRSEFLRGIMEADADGEWSVRSAGPQGSGILSSMARANCFIVLEESRGNVEPGSLVKVQPFDSLNG